MPFGTSNPAEHYHLLSSEISLVSLLSNDQTVRALVWEHSHIHLLKDKFLLSEYIFYYRELKYNFLSQLYLKGLLGISNICYRWTNILSSPPELSGYVPVSPSNET